MSTSVDLFAGCGGLSLGLEQAGFEGVFVNELHQDAMSTYLLNRGDTRLKERENHSFDVLSITRKEGELEALASRLRRQHGDISLVVGGPPCQGYSGIGHRRSFLVDKEEIPSNHLYREMAAVVEAIAPKAFVFENVKGLLTSRWTPGGDKGEIWRDVQSAFRRVRVRQGRKELEYAISWALVTAKDYGVPQNRPRVLMVGIRTDVLPSGISGQVANGFLPDPFGGAPDAIDVLGDLVDPDWRPGSTTDTYPAAAGTALQRRLRERRDGTLSRKGDPVSEHKYGKHAPHIVEKFQHMLDHDGQILSGMQTKKFAQRVIPARWGPAGPNITATSLPDDYVHFSQPRVPTVREWARIQTFPDWYQFAGKRTTGGRRRAGDPSTGNWSREVPKYTQIGNAVPVALGEAIGRHLREVLSL